MLVLLSTSQLKALLLPTSPSGESLMLTDTRAWRKSGETSAVRTEIVERRLNGRFESFYVGLNVRTCDVGDGRVKVVIVANSDFSRLKLTFIS